jgi:type IV secretory pathway VirB4 component
VVFIENYIGGVFNTKDYLSPSYINLNNPKYLEIDGIYYSSLLIVNYLREQNEIIFKNIIETNEDIFISIYYEKQDTYKVIKDLTYNIGNVGVNLESIGKSRQDVDIAAFTYNDAKYIRKEMQINSEQLYFIYTYITTFSKEKKELEYKINKIEGIMQSSGMQTKKAYFRQEQSLRTCLPFMENNKDVKETTKRNILTSGIPATYPFISSSIFDETGIFIGSNIYNESLVFIDKYDSLKYKNSNMCIFGTSGAGKSFFTKLMILRYSQFGISQYIIDPEREYEAIAKNLKELLKLILIC